MLKYFIFYKIASQILNSRGCYLFTGIRRESFILFFNFYITLNGNSLFEYIKNLNVLNYIKSIVMRSYISNLYIV